MNFSFSWNFQTCFSKSLEHVPIRSPPPQYLYGLRNRYDWPTPEIMRDQQHWPILDSKEKPETTVLPFPMSAWVTSDLIGHGTGWRPCRSLPLSSTCIPLATPRLLHPGGTSWLHFFTSARCNSQHLDSLASGRGICCGKTIAVKMSLWRMGPSRGSGSRYLPKAIGRNDKQFWRQRTSRVLTQNEIMAYFLSE